MLETVASINFNDFLVDANLRIVTLYLPRIASVSVFRPFLSCGFFTEHHSFIQHPPCGLLYPRTWPTAVDEISAEDAELIGF